MPKPKVAKPRLPNRTVALARSDWLRSKELRAAVVAAGALEPLVKLARTGDADGKQNAAWALENLAAGSEELKVKAVVVAALEPLVELLRAGDADGKQNAASTLGGWLLAQRS